MAHHFRNQDAKFGRTERLRQVAVHARFEAALPLPGHGVCGQSDDSRVAAGPAVALADGRRGRIAIHLGHLAIHQNEIEPHGLDCSNGFPSVPDRFHLATQFLQLMGGDEPIDRTVLGKEDAQLIGKFSVIAVRRRCCLIGGVRPFKVRREPEIGTRAGLAFDTDCPSH